ncbi:unnamed protein product [Brassica rapa]|uniref:Uncharacterized protein n=1 Tax=Brassica campestris TaxID=3711 RepID=A0A8D9DE29_BRACM|nr:unnamed protein product [Brassica rapa]
MLLMLSRLIPRVPMGEIVLQKRQRPLAWTRGWVHQMTALRRNHSTCSSLIRKTDPYMRIWYGAYFMGRCKNEFSEILKANNEFSAILEANNEFSATFEQRLKDIPCTDKLKEFKKYFPTSLYREERESGRFPRRSTLSDRKQEEGGLREGFFTGDADQEKCERKKVTADCESCFREVMPNIYVINEIMNNNLLAYDEPSLLQAKEINLGDELDITAMYDF